MIRDDDENIEESNYGPWPWMVSLLMGFGMLALMFWLATGML